MKLTQTQIYILIGLGVLVLFAYQKGLFSPERGRQLNIAAAVQDGSSVTISDQSAQNMVTSFKNTIADSAPLGNFFSSSQLESLLVQASALSDANLLKVANTYAARYPNADYKTLYSLINSVNLGWGTVWYERKKLSDRLTALGAA